MGINSFYASVVSPFLRKTNFGERLDMALIAFNANLQFACFMYADSGSKIFSDSEIDVLFEDLDPESRETAKRFMHRQYKAPHNALMIHPKYFYSDAEKTEHNKVLKDFNKAIKHFRLPRHLTGPESLYYHHGLRFAPDFVKSNIAGKLFGDVGGWLGDSTLVFAGYAPEKTIIFEPDSSSRNKLEKILKRNRISKDKYDLHPFALADTHSISNGFECRTLDEVSADYATPFGVLKADVEGMGAAFLRGARKTIERDRPLLSLAIYHNEDEFAGIYQTLKSWHLDYHFEIKSLNPFAAHGEIILLAYPAEWAQLQ